MCTDGYARQSDFFSLRNNIIAVAICAFLFFVLCANVFAHTKNDKLNYILVKMEEADKKINTLKADYTQIIFYESTKEKQEVSGTLFLKKPSSIYINQRVPQEQQIYIDGKNIVIYTPENGQAVIDNWKNVIDGDFSPATIISFGSSWREIKKTNIINLGDENEKYIIIKINPVKNKRLNLKIYISKTSMYPEKAVVESEGVVVEIIFTSYTFNPVLYKNMFKFNAPDSVEIIKLN
ncbi:MAG: outer-membrane lipoprotein carrier protein LolA [Endomicrobium sp.]|jgi:chaperone LolA|nr:outer-membrane lipoprotein carrier protein LolA [Endomicrobium sp.]